MGCQHKLCHCEDASLVVGKAGYCSEACAKAPAGETCKCGHEECLVLQIRPLPSPPGGNPAVPQSPSGGGD